MTPQSLLNKIKMNTSFYLMQLFAINIKILEQVHEFIYNIEKNVYQISFERATK